MSSNKIEHKIDEIQDYIDQCKYKPFSKDYIEVNHEKLEGYMEELREVIPDESRHNSFGAALNKIDAVSSHIYSGPLSAVPCVRIRLEYFFEPLVGLAVRLLTEGH